MSDCKGEGCNFNNSPLVIVNKRVRVPIGTPDKVVYMGKLPKYLNINGCVSRILSYLVSKIYSTLRFKSKEYTSLKLVSKPYLGGISVGLDTAQLWLQAMPYTIEGVEAIEVLHDNAQLTLIVGDYEAEFPSNDNDAALVLNAIHYTTG